MEQAGGHTKHDTVVAWLEAINEVDPDNAFGTLGLLIEDIMEREDPFGQQDEDKVSIESALTRRGLKYDSPGKIRTTSAAVGSSTASLKQLLQRNDFPAILDEFSRATDNTEGKPREAASAAANILEAVCKEYIVQHDLEMPSRPDLSSVFSVVRKHLGFDPSLIEDEDLKTILSGLITLVGGIARLRTHASSAHAQATTKRTYKLEPRHARLSVHAAHALVAFILETWENARAKPKPPVLVPAGFKKWGRAHGPRQSSRSKPTARFSNDWVNSQRVLATRAQCKRFRWPMRETPRLLLCLA